MNLAWITAQQVLVLFILIFAGFFSVKTGLVKMEAKQAFSDLLVHVVMPVTVLYSYMTDFDPATFANLLTAFWLSTVLVLAGIVITFLATWGMKDEDRPIFQFAGMFCNAVYMGFPLIQALYGQEGLLYASAYVTVYNLFFWTLGFSLVSGSRGKGALRTLLHTPVFYCVALGLVIYLGRVPIPELIRQPMGLITGINTPIAMFITGMMIAGSRIGQLLRDKRLAGLLLLRLVLIPAVCVAASVLLGCSGMAASVALLLEACPCPSITPVFALQYHYNEDFGAGAVVFSTLLSIVTLPACAMLLMTLLPS
ncbi:MAG: AEC family transporter [Clostridiales bacterium]|nr:AEC family transporter [Clostridiales bacterium]